LPLIVVLSLEPGYARYWFEAGRKPSFQILLRSTSRTNPEWETWKRVSAWLILARSYRWSSSKRLNSGDTRNGRERLPVCWYRGRLWLFLYHIRLHTCL